MSARARAKSVETCSPGQEIPCTWCPAGKYGGSCDLSARWRATCTTVYFVSLSALSAGQRQPGLGEDEGGRAARVDADVTRDERKTEEEDVELAAITSYLHLAGFELRGGQRAFGASLSLTRYRGAPAVTRHVYATLSRCLADVGEGKTGLVHCSCQSEDSGVGADAPRPPPARIKLPNF